MFIRHFISSIRTILLGIAVLITPLPGQDDSQLDEKLHGLYQRQQFDDAEKLLSNFLKKNPGNNDRRVELARLLDHVGKTKESIKLLEAGIGDKESDDELWWHLGRLWLARGDDGPNVTRSGGMVTYHPSKMTDEEEKEWKRKEYKKAVKAYRTILKGNPDHSETAEFLLQALQGALPPEKIGDEIETLVEKFPENLNIGLAYGDSLLSKNSPEQAIKVFEKFLKMSPRNSVIHQKLSDAYKASGDENAAKENEARSNFYKWMPPFTKVNFSKDILNKIDLLKGDRETMEKTVKALIADESQTSTDLMAAVCWHHLAHGPIENSCFEELEKRGEGDLLVDLIENAQSICTAREGGKALARMKHPEALRILSQMVEADQRPVWTINAAGSLEILGDERAVGVLIKTADPDFRESMRQRSEEESDFMGRGPYLNRVRCIFALGAFPNDQSKQALIKASRNPDLALASEFALYRITKDEKHLKKGFELTTKEPSLRHHVKYYIETKINNDKSREALQSWEKEHPEKKEKKE